MSGGQGFDDILGSIFGHFPQDDSYPKADPVQEARRLAREWRRLAARMHEVWPDEDAA